MISKAITKYARISPYKLRDVAKLVKGEKVEKSLIVLSLTNKRAAKYLSKVIKSCLDNAKNVSPGIDTAVLYISRIICNEGPMYKRYKPRAFGRGAMIRKRTSHIRVELDKK